MEIEIISFVVDGSAKVTNNETHVHYDTIQNMTIWRRRNIRLSPKPPIQTENQKSKSDTTKQPQKTSITQRLRTDLGQPVGVLKRIYQKYTW